METWLVAPACETDAIAVNAAAPMTHAINIQNRTKGGVTGG
jgi:hypothetical protein